MVRVVLLAVLANAYNLKAGVSPTQKVIQLLQDMAAKGRHEKQEEQVRFAAYKQFCDGTAEEKKASIAAAADQIEQLQADIQKAQSDAGVLARDVAALDVSIGGWDGDKAQAKSMRDKEHKDFSVTHRDYSESLDALDRAIVVLKKQSYDRTQGAALLQQVSVLAKIPESAKRVISSFLATDSEISQDPLAVSAPQANAYEFQSGGVVDMLQNLKDKFEDEVRALEKDEMQAQHAFELMSQELTENIKQANAEMSGKAKTKAEREEAAAQAQGDLSDTTAAHAEDSKYLSSLNSQCTQKSDDFEKRQQLRAEELEAIQKAVEILSAGLVGNSETYSADRLGLAQQQAFILRGSHTAVSPLQKNVASFLEARATKIGSRILSVLASKVKEDPFGKVKKMIDDMITRLLNEAQEEADHKGWCDTEMGTNKHTREAKAEDVNTLHAQIDQLSADITKLSEEIADLSAAVAELDAAVAKATENREKESAKNKETVEDAKEAQTAVSQALAVLKDFYAKAGQGAENMKVGYDGRLRSFVQGKQPEADAPGTWSDEPYTGMGDNAGGVVGMLEVIQADFARLEAETSAAEDGAANEHRRFLAESDRDKAVKETDLDHKQKTKTSKESDLNDAQKDLQGVQRELDAALFYYEKLKPSCVDAGVSYDDRVKRREEEIESLREALRILSDDA
jgi:uncharacterized protein YoxC